MLDVECNVVEFLSVVDFRLLLLLEGFALLWLREGGVIGIDLLVGVDQVLIIQVLSLIRHLTFGIN